MERIAKFIARSGACSRRDAEKLIGQKRVTVNGETIESPAFNVSGEEKIAIDGEKLSRTEPVRLWLFYKPAGLLSTHKDPQGRPTVFERLPAGFPRVIRGAARPQLRGAASAHQQRGTRQETGASRQRLDAPL